MQNNKLQELMEITSLKLGLTQFSVEKDYFITRAIHALTSINNEYFELVFQGGTCLSKAYQIVERLSEDIDFRVALTEKGLSLGKAAKRNKLRDFRHTLVCALKEAGFNIPEADINVFYEGRFMSIRAQFSSSAPNTYLKPHIAIECFVGDLVLNPKTKNITTLIQRTLGEQCNHGSKPVICLALDETLAEKWVALTRRVANAQIRERISDKQLVRHLYDIHHLLSSSLLSDQYSTIIKNIIEKDRSQFKSHNEQYHIDPVGTSLRSVKILQTQHWQDHWNRFLAEMVYEKQKPSFDDAYSSLKQITDTVLESL